MFKVPSLCAWKRICLSSELTAFLFEGVAAARLAWTHALSEISSLQDGDCFTGSKDTHLSSGDQDEEDIDPRVSAGYIRIT